jgi:3D (Asp-Asp-Asp) domain-containing protein
VKQLGLGTQPFARAVGSSRGSSPFFWRAGAPARATALWVLGGGMLGCGIAACSTAGSTWVAGPSGSDTSSDPRSFQPPEAQRSSVQRRPVTRILEPTPSDAEGGAAERSATTEPALEQPEASSGSELGMFRNTYYNFPHQLDYGGPSVSLFDAQCQPLAQVPRVFHDTLCVQGSGSLASGRTVSFARRDCACARTCPRSGQKICFAELDPKAFPWGRGAAGTAITPLRSVAVDIKVIPLGTPLFIPEFVGMPLDARGTGTHDGCFIAEDRGIKVVGQHVDVFTGRVAMTKVWDARIPTNQGVTVFLDSPRCSRPD